jgi:hypothetical protein
VNPWVCPEVGLAADPGNQCPKDAQEVSPAGDQGLWPKKTPACTGVKGEVMVSMMGGNPSPDLSGFAPFRSRHSQPFSIPNNAFGKPDAREGLSQRPDAPEEARKGSVSWRMRLDFLLPIGVIAERSEESLVFFWRDPSPTNGDHLSMVPGWCPSG